MEDLGTVGAPTTWRTAGWRVSQETEGEDPDSDCRIWGEGCRVTGAGSTHSHPFSCLSVTPVAPGGWLEPRKRRGAPRCGGGREMREQLGLANTAGVCGTCRDRAGPRCLGGHRPPGSGKLPAGPTLQLYQTSGTSAPHLSARGPSAHRVPFCLLAGL